MRGSRLHLGIGLEGVQIEWHPGRSDIGSLADRLLRDGLDAADDDLAQCGSEIREVAICAQGSHDICCGAEGMRLVEHARQRVRTWGQRAEELDHFLARVLT